MGNDFLGNYFYGRYGDSAIVCREESGDLFVRVYSESGNYRDYYTTAAGTKEEWLARQNGDPIFVPHTDAFAYERTEDDTVNAGSEQSDNELAEESGDAWYDREWRQIAAENHGWTEQQVYDEMTRRINEAEWMAEYKKLIQDIADSGSPEEREQKIIAHMSELIAYWSSGIGTGNDLRYLRDNLSNSPLSRELIYRIAPNNPAFVDAELSDQDKELGYHLDYNPNGILWRVNAAGIPHLEDFYKFEEQQKVLQGSLRALTPSESIIFDIKSLVRDAPEYVLTSAEQVVFGNYTNNVTVLGTAGQVGVGLLNLDLPADVRDINYDLRNWEWSWSHAGQTAVDAVGLFPGIGAIKYTDEVVTLIKKGEKTAKEIRTVEKEASNNYRTTFFTQHPELEGEVIVHHSVEQQVLKRPETMGLFTKEEINAYNNLRGIPKELNSDLHLSTIRKEWNEFYRENPFPSKEDLFAKSREIDMKYGKLFNPPIE